MEKVKIRGFEPVVEEKRKGDGTYKLPVRADKGSAGYDFFTPVSVVIKPNEQVLIWTNVKSYMLENEVLNLYVRSSVGIEKGLMLANTVGIIDASYYSNKKNDGNIGICLKNMSNQTVVIEAGERVAQGVFMNYLVADDDNPLKQSRDGGMGSSNDVNK